MPDEKKSRLPEFYFLPPLDMILTFFDRTLRKQDAQETSEEQKESDEKNVERLIEKLSEKEE